MCVTIERMKPLEPRTAEPANHVRAKAEPRRQPCKETCEGVGEVLVKVCVWTGAGSDKSGNQCRLMRASARQHRQKSQDTERCHCESLLLQPVAMNVDVLV